MRRERTEQKPKNECEESKVKSEIEIAERVKRILADKSRVESEIEIARQLRMKKFEAMGTKVLERYNYDADYRFLHDQISDVFAEALVSDIAILNSNRDCKISLASKWCPSLYSSFDRTTLLCESIAKRVFPRSSYPEYEGVEEEHYAYRVRDRLRKEVLVPLLAFLKFPEIFMPSNNWKSIPYNRVSSIAMRNYTKNFFKHDELRFGGYLDRVRRGEAKIAAGALLPHEILQSLYEEGSEVADLQWRRMVEDLSTKGKLKNCLAICAVSGSMYGTPIKVSVALGLLISELSEDPWKGKLITFSQNPQLHKIEGDDLFSKTEFVRQMHWDMSTNFQKNLRDSCFTPVLGKQKGVAQVSGFSKNMISLFLEGDENLNLEVTTNEESSADDSEVAIEDGCSVEGQEATMVEDSEDEIDEDSKKT
ncbi:hypothetical protein GIB67_009396 [Kingdonia uniflora]|uniref:Uncharacterized protein n=1 Tax=Kingdonia uniflora TaxID=39325 RepID=A0A7J7N320_9MAGN|nr:hypothetical protein GIB67_009396 [Kingdonia uniflora]